MVPRPAPAENSGVHGDVDPRALRNARRTAGLRQRDLASALGLAQQAISQYETGAVPFPLAHLDTAARVLEVSPDDLIHPNPADSGRHLAAVPHSGGPTSNAISLAEPLEQAFQRSVVEHMFEMTDEERRFARDVGRSFFGLDL
ncbi:MAG: helix-turn-helix domain-containing protein [Aquihabitans sp.]